MLRAALLLLAAPLVAFAAEPKPLPALVSHDLEVPAAAHSVGASLIAGPDGTLHLSWVETGRTNVLRFAQLDATSHRWSAARTIAQDASLTTNAADFPQLAVDGTGRITAIWTDGHGGARRSDSRDRGATWSVPAPWTTDGHEVEKFSLAPLADGRVLVAWLDGRGHIGGAGVQQLYARILDTPGPDMLIDASVCDCCQTALAAFLDGGAVVSYRGRTADEVRDIRIARFRGGQWEPPHPLNNDGWRINACPVNGPRLASDGSRVGVAWFTGADNDPRVLASFSPDAGARFLMPLRIDRGKPVGHADTAILRDGAVLVTWTEQDGSVWLRRITPEFDATEPIALADPGSVSRQCVPRMAMMRDYAGGFTAAEVLVAFAREKTGVAAVLVTVPEGALIEAERNCECAPTAEELRGFPIRGSILGAPGEAGSVRIQHAEVPGVFGAGTREVRVAADARSSIQPGREFLGRIERRDGAWWLFNVRLLAVPSP
jgi:hypothetical protein